VYTRAQLVKKAEQLQKQLDFLNEENNKLTSSYISATKELSFYQSSKREIDILSKKLVLAEDQKTKLETQIVKVENMNKRLNEQFEKSKKHVLNESTMDLNKQFTQTLKDQKGTIDLLQQKVDQLSLVEAAYNSDKKMFAKSVEQLQAECERVNTQLQTVQGEKSDVEQLVRISEQKLSMLHELNDNLRSENNRLRSSFDKVGQDSSFMLEKVKELNAQTEALGKEKIHLILQLDESAKEVNRLKAELVKKAEQLQHFNSSIENIKENLELENRRNHEVLMNMESLNNELKIKENENLKLDQ